MAGSKLKLNSRLKASTILEVIISMVIILLVFGIAMMISVNVMRASLSQKKLNAQTVLQELLIKAEKNAETGTQSFTIDDLTIHQDIKGDEQYIGLLDIHLIAFDSNNEKVMEVQKIVVNKNE